MSKPSQHANRSRDASRPSARPPSTPEGHPKHRLDDGCAFLPDPSEGTHARRGNPLGEMLAKEFLESATAGEEVFEDERSELEIEEFGGPFTGSTANEEFAYGADDSNPKNAPAEAFPTTRSVRP
jgi:hypothetical protein